MHTSPDRDARLLPWIDAVGPRVTQVIPGWRNWKTRPAVDRESGRSSRSPGADEQQGYARLMACLMHDDDVTCECCRSDKMPTRKKVYYIACAVILAAWILGFGAWLMFSTYPAILYP